MAAANVISVIGTFVSILGIITSNVPEAPDKAKVQYIIANDDPDGTGLTGAGGDMPDVRMFDETIEFLGANYDPGHCDEGYTTCTTEVNTQEAVTYTLFTGNNDALCIAWTGMSWAGGQKKYGFHPGNWAHACDVAGYDPATNKAGNWYYAAQKVPGINNDDDVFCAWVDRDGDVDTTGFQVHWPEFDDNENGARNLDYYCANDPPVNFRNEYEPNGVIYRRDRRDIFASDPSVARSPAVHAPSKARRNTKKESLSKRFERDTRIIKSYYPKHKATELCDRSLSAVGQSFVSYEEQKFCYMPTKTLYPFCSATDVVGACWDDEKNVVTIQGNAKSRLSSEVPDLGHIDKVIVWGEE